MFYFVSMKVLLYDLLWLSVVYSKLRYPMEPIRLHDKNNCRGVIVPSTSYCLYTEHIKNRWPYKKEQDIAHGFVYIRIFYSLIVSYITMNIDKRTLKPNWIKSNSTSYVNYQKTIWCPVMFIWQSTPLHGVHLYTRIKELIM